MNIHIRFENYIPVLRTCYSVQHKIVAVKALQVTKQS